MTAQPRQLAECRTFEALRNAFRRRIEELGITYETVDEIAGYPTRYTSKIMSPDALMGMGIMSIEAMLGALGLKLIVVEDVEALALVASRHVQRRKASAVRRPFERVILNGVFMSTIGRLGGKKSAETRRARAVEKKATSEIKRQAALRRWSQPEIQAQNKINRQEARARAERASVEARENGRENSQPK